MKTAALLVALLVIASCGAIAQEQQQPVQQQQQQTLQPPQPAEGRRTFAMAGVFELGGSLSFASQTPVINGATGSASQNLAFAPTLGYFVIDQLEIVVNPLMVSYSWSGGSNTINLMPMAGVAYNFRANPRAFPYLEGVAGYAYSRWSSGSTTSTQSGFAWAGRGGVKLLVTGTAIVNIALQYQQVTLNHSGVTERNGYNQIGVTAGLAVWL